MSGLTNHALNTYIQSNGNEGVTILHLTRFEYYAFMSDKHLGNVEYVSTEQYFMGVWKHRINEMIIFRLEDNQLNFTVLGGMEV